MKALPQTQMSSKLEELEPVSISRGGTCSEAWRSTADTRERTAASARCCKARNLPAYAPASAYLYAR